MRLSKNMTAQAEGCPSYYTGPSVTFTCILNSSIYVQAVSAYD